MAFIPVSQDEFNCCVCLDLLRDPVTVSCGHSFCLNCITGCWNQEDQKGVYSCPQCRETFTPRPVLRRNTMLTEVIEKLKKTELQSDGKAPFYAGPGDVECDFCIGRKHKATKSCLTCMGSYCEVHIQPHYEVTCLKKHKLVNAISQLQGKICSQHDRIIEVFCRTDKKLICMLCLLNDHNGHKTVSAAAEWAENQTKLHGTKMKNKTHIQQREKELQEVKQALQTLKAFAQEAVEDSERMFTELISFMEQKRSEVTESIRAQERAEVSRAEELLEQLELEITKLKSSNAEIEELLQKEDPIDFLQSFSLTSPQFEILSSVTSTPHLSFTEIKGPALMEIKQTMSKFNPGFRIGDRVQVRASVQQPKNGGWGGVTHKSLGVITSFSSHGYILVDFPEWKQWKADPFEIKLVLRIGDRVRVKASVQKPTHGGWGGVTHKSVGVITSFSSHGYILVDFPEWNQWMAEHYEIELVL
ncbi:hypothetical protein AALO_G00037820 [Alosa alosa]|uniref:E3 ubiquitin/ISG15 ligase TRIM25-like n=1 Tax=Alosa alosa TaxID=278164 RepID=A0AAV6HBY7_9TELE|nr:E3 ubiquitin/ISG15 ligase TRIM25-like isoform X1 [Alosa alosa]KAG5283057.1 hypothetical protein AALO_G00037820 [Alosa alosa]